MLSDAVGLEWFGAQLVRNRSEINFMKACVHVSDSELIGPCHALKQLNNHEGASSNFATNRRTQNAKNLEHCTRADSERDAVLKKLGHRHGSAAMAGVLGESGRVAGLSSKYYFSNT